MNLKQLIKEVERLKPKADTPHFEVVVNAIKYSGIKQTVEAVDRLPSFVKYQVTQEFDEDWQKLKELLGVK